MTQIELSFMINYQYFYLDSIKFSLLLTNQNQNQNQNQLLMNKLQLETLRVIINILANNDLNRDFSPI